MKVAVAANGQAKLDVINTMHKETVMAGRERNGVREGQVPGHHEGASARDRFRRFGAAAATVVGSPWAFAAAVLVVAVWAATGPLFHYSDTWQLVINTGTTVITFLMVFLIQNTQNRDAKAIHLKLDELIRGVKGARTNLVDLEDMTEEELDRLQREFQQLHERKSGNAADEDEVLSARPGEPERKQRQQS